MDRHSLVSGLVLGCITVCVCIILHVLAEFIERKAVKKWWKENSTKNFDIEN